MQALEAWVGVHKGTDKAKGRLAKADLCYWKIEAHAAFDPIWKSSLGNGEAKHTIRNRSYARLAKELNLERSVTHIGFFDVDLCKRLVEICNNENPFAENTSEIKHAIKVVNKPNNINSNKRSGLSEPSYHVFDFLHFAQFKKKFYDNYRYDHKKFCYIITAPL